jgi:hypothetical protein
MCGANAKMLDTLSLFGLRNSYIWRIQMKNGQGKWCSHIIFPDNILKVEASMRLMKDMIKSN